MANILHLETTTLNCGVAIFSGSEVIASKSIREKYKSKLKPIAQRVKDALETGEAKYITTPGKHIFTFKLR